MWHAHTHVCVYFNMSPAPGTLHACRGDNLCMPYLLPNPGLWRPQSFPAAHPPSVPSAVMVSAVRALPTQH